MSATITAKTVADLRARTGAGMMECKRALEESAGDMDRAVELLRAKGTAKAEKRAGREAAEGQIGAHLPDGRIGVMVEVNCETDFVARTDDFQGLVRDIATHVAGAEPADVETLLGQPFGDGSKTVEQHVKEISGKVGENVVVRRFARFALADGAHGRVDAYVHFNGKVGVLVHVRTDADVSAHESLQQFAKDVALHAASAKPLSLTVDQLPAEVVETERRVYLAQAKESGKPEAVQEKIVEGKLRKYYEETVLLHQKFVKDDSKTIEQLAKETAAAVGTDVAIEGFALFELGGE